ncbi:DNA modification methylase [Sphingomonas sp. UYEF23]
MRKIPSSKRAKSTSSDFDFGIVDPIIFGEIEYMQLDQIKVPPGNPRKHDAKNLEAIAKAIAATRVMTPLVVNSRNELASGEGRLGAARLLKLTTVPVLRAEALTQEQFLAFRIADNRIAELSCFDDKALALALQELSSTSLTFNIEHIGFDLPEIDIRIDSLSAAVNPDEDPGDLLPAMPSPAVTLLGDVWLCGDHRIICGSALDPLVYQALMRDERARMSIQDPPYNVSVTKHVGGLGAIQHREFAMASGEMSEDEFFHFLASELDLAQQYLVKGTIFMAFIDWRSIDKLIAAGKAAGLELVNLCVWNKTNASLGSLYRSKHELVAVFKKPGARHTNNVQLGSYGRYRTNVWDAPGCNTFGANRMAELASHPTVKPVALVADAIRDVSHRGEIVLDSFGGSGTTMIAAERTGRIGYLIELDPIYVDTTVRRWEAFTGRQAVLEASGQIFADTADARAAGTKPAVFARARTRPIAA